MIFRVRVRPSRLEGYFAELVAQQRQVGGRRLRRDIFAVDDVTPLSQRIVDTAEDQFRVVGLLDPGRGLVEFVQFRRQQQRQRHDAGHDDSPV